MATNHSDPFIRVDGLLVWRFRTFGVLGFTGSGFWDQQSFRSLGFWRLGVQGLEVLVVPGFGAFWTSGALGGFD